MTGSIALLSQVHPVANLLSDAFASVANDVLKNIVSALLQGLTEAIKSVGSWWSVLPSPTLVGDSGDSPAQRIMQYTRWLVPIVGLISTCFLIPAIAARRGDRETTLRGLFGMFRLLLFTGAGLSGISIILGVSDASAPWLIQNISGGTFEEGLGTLTGNTAAVASGESAGVLVLLIPVVVIAALGSLLTVVLLFFSYGMLPILAGMLPITAAASFTEKGDHALRKVLGWIVALMLFKPISAIIYGAGIAMMKGVTGGIAGNNTTDQAGQVVLQMLYGMTVICAAAVALPALLRIVAPATAAGSRGGGGAEAIMGAALIATGALTGGATVAAAGAGAAGGGGAVTGGSLGGATTNASGASISGGRVSGASSDPGSSSGGGPVGSGEPGVIDTLGSGAGRAGGGARGGSGGSSDSPTGASVMDDADGQSTGFVGEDGASKREHLAGVASSSGADSGDSASARTAGSNAAGTGGPRPGADDRAGPSAGGFAGRAGTVPEGSPGSTGSGRSGSGPIGAPGGSPGGPLRRGEVNPAANRRAGAPGSEANGGGPSGADAVDGEPTGASSRGSRRRGGGMNNGPGHVRSSVSQVHHAVDAGEEL